MGTEKSKTTMHNDEFFQLIDVDNNGKIDQKELRGFMVVMFNRCEDDSEREAVSLIVQLLMRCAKENRLGADDFMTKDMMDEFEPPEKLVKKMDENQDAIDKLMKDLASEEDQVRTMLKEANDQSVEDIQKALDQIMKTL